MGFFGNLFSARRMVQRAMEKQEERLRALSALPDAELAGQEDAALCEVLSFRNDRAADAKFGEPHARNVSLADCYASFTGARRSWAMVDLFAMETEADGLCGVLTGELRTYARELPGLLRTVGAAEHAALLEAFFRDNGIDPADMDSFLVGHDLTNDYAAQEARYPYRAFNRAYEKLPPLTEALAAYGRAHLAEFQNA